MKDPLVVDIYEPFVLMHAASCPMSIKHRKFVKLWFHIPADDTLSLIFDEENGIRICPADDFTQIK